MSRNKLRVFPLFLLMFFGVPALALAGNSFLITELRVDNPSVTTGQFLDYRHFLYAASGSNVPTNTSEFVTAWFGVNLAQYNGSKYSAQFSQVGIMVKGGLAHWFIYAEPGVKCLRGTKYWQDQNNPNLWRGCIGNFGDLNIYPGSNAWTRVEFVTYPGQSWWIARVYHTNGTAHDVAKIYSSSKQIFAAHAWSEEGYIPSNDPYYAMNFYHYHPEYHTGSGFVLWPGGWSGAPNVRNRIEMWPISLCPAHYNAEINIQGNPHLWRFASVIWNGVCGANPLF